MLEGCKTELQMFLSVEDVEILPLLSTGPCRFGLVESEMSELEVVFTLEKVKLCFSFGSEALSMPSFLVAEEAPIGFPSPQKVPGLCRISNTRTVLVDCCFFYF